MSGIGKQFKGSGIARPGVSSTREGFKKGGSAKIGPFLQTMGEYKNLAKSKELHMKKVVLQIGSKVQLKNQVHLEKL